MLGQILGRYKILNKIGGGGFATVYLGRDTRNNEVVAIKVLREQYAEDAEFLRRFHREAAALRALPAHPNIVHLRDFGEANGVHYLIMDYLKGLDLTQVISQRGRLPLQEALSIAYQVAAALAAAHQAGIVHRDIKPGNIKVTSDGTVKVMDFGIARAIEGTRLTSTGLFVGTPAYLAPEVWEGQPADARSDIYALGVVLYELLTGRPPFHADTPAAIMRQHLMQPPTPLRSIRYDIPPWVEVLLARMLAKNPTERFQTVAELLAALEARGQVAVSAPTATGPLPTQMLNTLATVPLPAAQPVVPLPPTPPALPPTHPTVNVPARPLAPWAWLTCALVAALILFMGGLWARQSRGISPRPMPTATVIVFASPTKSLPSLTATVMATATPTKSPLPPKATATALATPTNTATSRPTSTLTPTSPPPPTLTLTPRPTNTLSRAMAQTPTKTACPSWYSRPEPGKGVLLIENHIGKELLVEQIGSSVKWTIAAKQGDTPGRLLLQLSPGVHEFMDYVGGVGRGHIKVQIEEGKSFVSPIWFNDRYDEYVYPLQPPPGCE